MSRDPLDALNEARDTMPHPCPECGEMMDEDECPDCGAYWTHECHLCKRPMPRAIGCALCGTCRATGEAHGRMLRDEMRYPDPEPRHR